MSRLRKLGFLTIGLFDEADPAAGHETTLRMIELGERLGFDSAWVRHRHLQFGISSPIAVLAAASQRTRRIELGTAVIPLGWENPLRLAEDLATVDILSGGRLNPGVSVGQPMHYDHVKHALYPHTADLEDFGYERVRRLLDFVRGEPASDFEGTEGFEVFSRRVQPHSPGLIKRMWYGGGSLRSARWAGEQGMNFLTSSVVKAEESEDFAEIQLSHIRAFRAAHPDADFLIHPECGCSTSVMEYVASGDVPSEGVHMLSTGGMLKYAEEHRGKGHGRRLMDWAMRVFQESGITRMEVKVVDGNPAVHLYERYGFRIKSHIMLYRSPE